MNTTVAESGPDYLPVLHSNLEFLVPVAMHCNTKLWLHLHHCTAPYSAACTAPRCTAQHSTAKHSTAQ